MAKEILSIANISCGHCVMAIKKKLTAMEGVKAVEGNPEKKSISVEWEAPATRDKITEALKGINYPVS